MSSIKIKKLTLQYSYLLLEKEEVDEICLNTEKEIREFMKNNYPEEYNDLFGDKKRNFKNQEPKKESGEVSEEYELKTKKKNDDVKKLYRRIAEKTHPDKIGNNEHASVFSEASLAYKEQDIATLLNIAGRLNIELIELSPESVKLLENNVNSLSDHIDNKKTTTSWAFHVARNDEEKKAVVQAIINHIRSNTQ
jgi:hypothetical protein